MLWVRRFLMTAAPLVGLLIVGCGLAEPAGNRIYAETWRQAPVAELLKAQGLPRETVFRSDGTTVITYHLGPWRGMKGRTYPGSTFSAISGNRYMESGVHLYTAPAHTYCDIDFIANGAGVIEDITYSGNDCG